MRYRVAGDGRIERDANERPVEHDKTKAPICRRVPCGKFDAPKDDKRTPLQIIQDKPQFWPRSWYPVLDRYRLFVALGIPPRTGGLDQQDWLEMRIFAAVKTAEESCEKQGKRELMSKSGPLGGLFALAMLK